MLKKNVQPALRNYQRQHVKQVYSAEHTPTVFALKVNTERKTRKERNATDIEESVTCGMK